MKPSLSFLVILFLFGLTACNPVSDTTPPTVMSTSPENGAVDVDPSLTEISVTFDEPMVDKGWSWTYQDQSKFPTLSGDPSYRDDRKTNVLPVKVEAGKEYEIWINSDQFQNFKDKAGNPALPYQLKFRTKE